jgi:hypothetical protein
MSNDDRKLPRKRSDESGDAELPVGDLNPPPLNPEAAEKVRGGLTPAAPSPVPIPYPARG